MKFLMFLLLCALVAVSLATFASGGAGLGDVKPRAKGAELLVTRDFGAVPIASAKVGSIPKGETVMKLLEREVSVQTRPGSNFVRSIDGLASVRRDGRNYAWYYFVNGVLADAGATQRELADGDRVWWDYRDASAARDVNAIVGSFPEPFRSGKEGRRQPVRLDCANDSGEQCDRVAERLAAIDVLPGRAAVGQFGGEALVRIKVGHWDDVREDVAVRPIELGPDSSGVFARPDRAGRRLELLDPDGKPVRTLAGSWGLVAATALPTEAATWVVTGADAAGIEAAADQLREQPLKGRFAIAVADGKPIALPVPK